MCGYALRGDGFRFVLGRNSTCEAVERSRSTSCEQAATRVSAVPPGPIHLRSGLRPKPTNFTRLRSILWWRHWKKQLGRFGDRLADPGLIGGEWRAIAIRMASRAPSDSRFVLQKKTNSVHFCGNFVASDDKGQQDRDTSQRGSDQSTPMCIVSVNDAGRFTNKETRFSGNIAPIARVTQASRHFQIVRNFRSCR